MACCCCFSSSLQRCDNVDATVCLHLYWMVTYLLGGIYRFVMLSHGSCFKSSFKVENSSFKMNHPPSLLPPWRVQRRQGSSSREREREREVLLLWKVVKVFCFFFRHVLQFLRNEADLQGRSSRSPVTLFDIQDNNNVNSFAVSSFIGLAVLNAIVLYQVTSFKLFNFTVEHPFAFSRLPFNQCHFICAASQV